jgi:ABC-type transporter Mla MlaB component
MLMIIGGPIARADIAALCESVRLLLQGSAADVVVCDVGALVDPDVAAVDALARLQLTAQRLGRGIRLQHASEELIDLLSFMGLRDAVLLYAELPLEAQGKPEEGKEPRRVEKEADSGDLTG